MLTLHVKEHVRIDSDFSLGGEREQNKRFIGKFRKAPPNDCIYLIFTVHTYNKDTILCKNFNK